MFTGFHRAMALLFLLGASFCRALEPIPDKLVVLTFDDSSVSHYSFVRPLLKDLGFGATFFVTEGFLTRSNQQHYMTWTQIREMHEAGFEIGNHTRDHLGVSPATLGRLREQVEAIDRKCVENGIPKPISFAYPGNSLTPGALPILKSLGIRFARRGGSPEHIYDWGRGFAYEPGQDHPLLIPSAGDARPDWTLDDFKRAVTQARGGRIAVLQFHGVPDGEHSWVSSRPELFREYMQFLKSGGYTVIALRDLHRYVDPEVVPSSPTAVVDRRKATVTELNVEGEILDADTGRPIPARLHIQDAAGQWYFPKSTSPQQPAIRYERRNGSNPKSVEMHTTLPALPFKLELQPGRYAFRVEHGKEFLPETREVEVQKGMAKLSFRLKRWINMAEQGWYSGDTHNHRNPAEIPNVMLAEDVNVALPMVDWTTASLVSPADSRQGFSGSYDATARKVDALHAWYPRNTEYEIFNTGNKPHTLGAVVILNHRTRFAEPIIPLKTMAARARAEGALLDLEKHNWPWSIALAAILKVDLFELANNHHWAVDYAVRNWAVPAPSWMGLSGGGTSSERDWTDYGFQTYYALLNSGLRMKPAAGTANGVHPVPLGFSRVYVHLDEPFTFEAWMKALGQGRSFVTTGPMLLATADGHLAGDTIAHASGSGTHALECRVLSTQPLESVELVVNGVVVRRWTPTSTPAAQGGLETTVRHDFIPETDSWVVWRCYETRPEGRIRFAHSAPWYFSVPGKPLRPRAQEVEWLSSRVREEIQRSQGVAPAELIEDYREALRFYESQTPR